MSLPASPKRKRSTRKPLRLDVHITLSEEQMDKILNALANLEGVLIK